MILFLMLKFSCFRLKNSQLRGNLIYSKYKDPLHRVILTDDGRGVIAESNPPTELVGDHTLDVTQVCSTGWMLIFIVLRILDTGLV